MKYQEEGAAVARAIHAFPFAINGTIFHFLCAALYLSGVTGVLR